MAFLLLYSYLNKALVLLLWLVGGCTDLHLQTRIEYAPKSADSERDLLNGKNIGDKVDLKTIPALLRVLLVNIANHSTN